MKTKKNIVIALLLLFCNHLIAEDLYVFRAGIGGVQGSVSIPMNIQGNLQITGFIGADLNNTWIPMSRKRLGRNSLMWTLDPWNNSYKSLWISAYYGNLRFFTSNYLRMYIMQNGNIGINTNSPTSLLEINGTISADEYIVKISSGADYVFDKEYQLMRLSDVHKYICNYGHLPNIPSANNMQEYGLDISEHTIMLLSKIEELTLYIIEHDKFISEIEQELSQLKNTPNKIR